MGKFDEVDYDVIVIGGGFSGLYAAHSVRASGYTVLGFEKAPSVGGTWWWNRYPGARCDVDSVDYSYSFSEELEQEWSWSEKFATQPEILRYLEWVADRLDLRSLYEFDTVVTSAVFDAELADGGWRLATDTGREVTAKFVIAGTGNLSVPYRPDIAGIDEYQGEILQSARWPHGGVDFTGRRVAVVGTGSTGIQMIPEIATQAAELHVLQRTPNYSVPARNHPLDDEYRTSVKADYRTRRELARTSWSGLPFRPSGRTIAQTPAAEVRVSLDAAWRDGGVPRLMSTFDDISSSDAANDIVADFARDHIRDIVTDPQTAEQLMPSYPIGSKRIPTDSGYFEVFNRESVHLIDVNREPLERFTPDGIVVGGRHVEVDAVVFATGFDAVTGALLSLDPVGVGGVPLHEHWADGAKAFMGVSIAGFPNFFVIAGVGTATVVTAILPTIEHNVEWITRAIDWMGENHVAQLVATESAEAEWMGRCAELAAGTNYVKVKNWQNGQNIPGKRSGFMAYVGGVADYIRRADAAAADGYAGFIVTQEARDALPR
jgi:cation diffusion facilitator CzcD-associated flavoprotein CzcO